MHSSKKVYIDVCVCACVCVMHVVLSILGYTEAVQMWTKFYKALMGLGSSTLKIICLNWPLTILTWTSCPIPTKQTTLYIYVHMVFAFCLLFKWINFPTFPVLAIILEKFVKKAIILKSKMIILYTFDYFDLINAFWSLWVT